MTDFKCATYSPDGEGWFQYQNEEYTLQIGGYPEGFSFAILRNLIDFKNGKITLQKAYDNILFNTLHEDGGLGNVDIRIFKDYLDTGVVVYD